MALPDLDSRTLLAVLCMALALSSLALALLYRLHRSLPGPREWVIGMVSISSGVGLLYGRDFIPAFWSIVVANVLILAGHACLVAGIRRFHDFPPRWPGLISVIVLSGLPILLLYDAPEELGMRIIAISMGMGILAFLGARALTRNHQQLNAGLVVAALLAMHGTFCLARASQPLLQPISTADMMQVGPSMTFFFVWAILFFFGLTVGFSVMVTERLRDMLQDRLDEQNAARCAAEAALREQRNFLTMVSHEFRTPLGIMAASADLIAYNLPAEDRESAEELERIQRASRRLGNLVEGCLADDWLASMSVSRRSGIVDVGNILAELALEYDVTLHACPESLRVDADPYLLPIAFSALLDNACKYAQSIQGVLLSCHREKNVVKVAIYDDGPGIDDTEVSRLFEKFYRARRTQHKPGAGLGLYLVQRILSLHKGNIELDQTHGTMFCVTLPAIDT